MNRTIVVLAGPTAVGKTQYSIDLALALGGEIVSCDSMQLYKYMDIGSAKPTPEERAKVNHYLIDEIDPKGHFTVARYSALAKKAINEIFEKGKVPIITGGTGLYLNSLLYDMDFGPVQHDQNYRKKLEALLTIESPRMFHRRLEAVDKEAADRIHENNVKRVMRALESIKLSGQPTKDFASVCEKTKDYEVILMGLTRHREELYDRINQRVDLLIAAGLLDEVKALMQRGFTSEDIAMKGIGYKEIIDYFNGKYDLDFAIDLVKKNTRRYAKRQITWFNRYESLRWFNLSEYATSEEALEDLVQWVKKKS